MTINPKAVAIFKTKATVLAFNRAVEVDSQFAKRSGYWYHQKRHQWRKEVEVEEPLP